MNLPAEAAFFLDLWVFFLGACTGSFLNVCIHRIPREESIVAPRSRCPHCRSAIPWFDNIPVLSFLLLRAKCRRCGAAISARYVLVELLTAVLFVLIWRRYGISAETPVYWLVLGGLILGTFVDFEHMILPDRVTLGGIAAGLLLSPLVPALHGAAGAGEALLRAAGGAAFGAGLLWLVGAVGKLIFRKEAMGLGDVKLLGAIGAFTGWQGVLFTLMVSSLAGSVVGITLVLAGGKQWQSRIPYGPYLALAALLWILGGHALPALYGQWLLGSS